MSCWICSYIKNLELNNGPVAEQILNQPSSSINMQQYDNAISSDITLDTIISDLTEYEFLKEITTENQLINTEQPKILDSKNINTYDKVIRKQSDQYSTATLNLLNQAKNDNFLIANNLNSVEQKTILPITSVKKTTEGVEYIENLDATYEDPFRSYYESLEGVAFTKNTKETPRFRCLECNRFLHNWESVCFHINTHRHRRPYQCCICAKNYANRSGLKRHAVLKHDLFKQKFECVICKKNFFSAEELNRHNKLEISYLRFTKNNTIFPLGDEQSFKNVTTHNLPFVI